MLAPRSLSSASQSSAFSGVSVASTMKKNHVKDFLVASMSEATAEQRVQDNKRFSVIHDTEVMSRRRQWINELEARVQNTRAELLARTGKVALRTGIVLKNVRTKPKGIVGKIQVNKNFKIDPSGPYATNEAAARLYNLMKDEKVKLYHTVPRALNHSMHHSLESAEAPARRIIVVSPKQRASVMKHNAQKNIAMREKLSRESSNPSVCMEERTFRESIKGGIEDSEGGSSISIGMGRKSGYTVAPIVQHHPLEAANARSRADSLMKRSTGQRFGDRPHPEEEEKRDPLPVDDVYLLEADGSMQADTVGGGRQRTQGLAMRAASKKEIR